MPQRPAFMIHTGDITHLSKPAEFDTAAKIIERRRSVDVFYVPGEHDVLVDNGEQYLERFGKETRGHGWYSFDQGGVHFIGLVNVLEPEGRRPGLSRRRAARMAQEGSRRPVEQHADRRLRAHSAVDASIRNGAGAPRTATRALAC